MLRRFWNAFPWIVRSAHNHHGFKQIEFLDHTGMSAHLNRRSDKRAADAPRAESTIPARTSGGADCKMPRRAVPLPSRVVNGVRSPCSSFTITKPVPRCAHVSVRPIFPLARFEINRAPPNWQKYGYSVPIRIVATMWTERRPRMNRTGLFGGGGGGGGG